ncbi:MAG: ABC transporter substrate-binding protein [Deltaproteobacteria bacterium]|nr:ABC transporter substrate-binding protein [Deltaproteobacteria bacterium]
MPGKRTFFRRKAALAGSFLFAALAVLLGLPSGPQAVDSKLPRASGPVPSRIITMAPSITEIVFALGQGHRVAGVSDFCTYPPEALEKPSVGGHLNPNTERITVLGPDLVILQGKSEKTARFCEKRGIPMLFVDMDSIPTIYKGIRTIAKTLSCVDRGEALIRDIQARLDEVKKRIAGKKRRSVFICIGREPGGVASLYTTGGNSFVSQLVEIAGGDNIFADVNHPYPEASKEVLIRRAPEVILDIRLGRDISPEQAQKLKAAWKVLRGVPAVENGEIHVLTRDFLLVPGPRVGLATQRFAEVLHGEEAHE